MQLLGNIFHDIKEPYYIEEDELVERIKEQYQLKKSGGKV
jgi:hypothetical protein